MKTIYLIDDDPTMVLLLETLLELEGYKTIRWEGQKEIYEQINKIRPDLALLDVNLRGENGLEALEKIRSDSSLDGIKIVLTSGINYEEKARQHGADQFLQKPYMPADLIEMIKSQLSEVK